VAYSSPEQVRGGELDQRSDLFSFGVILYEMLTGRRPFAGDHEAAIVYSIVNEEPQPLAGEGLAVTHDLQRIVAKCLAKRPGDRYQSSENLAIDLKTIHERLASAHGRETKLQIDVAPSIAVLPFTNVSADKDQDYFCDGITEEITNALTKVEGMRVVARTSAFAFKGRTEDIRTIGEKLNVSALLEGSVRKAGTRLRITAQLVNVADGYHIWSERYDREISDIFAIQDEITLAIVDRLKISLLAGEKAKVVKRHTEDLEAYYLYLRGRHFWNRRYEGGLQKGIECFQQAIARDPLYAVAHSGMADSYAVLGYFGYLPPREAYPKAKSASAKALEIDPSLAEAHTSLGWIRTFFDWDWPGAGAAYSRALELNPRYALARGWHALYLTIIGRFDEAIAEAERAQETDPLSSVVNGIVGVVLYMARRYGEGIDQLKKVIEMDPTYILAYWYVSGCYMGKQMWSECEAAQQELLSLSVDSPLAMGAIGTTCAFLGRRDKASEMLRRLEKLRQERYVSPIHCATIYMGLGDKDQAFDQLDAALQARESMLAFLRVWPWFDSLRSEPRFQQLLEKVGLAE
jgi:serine/threonine-protein kinase